MDATFRERLDAIDWTGYETSYGTAIKVPGQLLRLAGGGEEAIDAGRDLWGGLCHGHAYVSSAALPALPFILEVLDRADEALTVEILDILLGFATCTRPADTSGTPPWKVALRHQVGSILPRLRALAAHPNEDIASFAQLIIEDFGQGAPLPGSEAGVLGRKPTEPDGMAIADALRDRPFAPTLPRHPMSDSIKDKLQDAGHKAADAAKNAGNKVAEVAKDAGNKAGEKAGEAAEWTKDKAHKAGEKLEEAGDAAKKKIDDATDR